MIRVHVSNFGIKSALRCSTKKGQYYVEPHIHQFSEIVLVREGELQVETDTGSEIAKKGDIVFISSFRTHSLIGSPDAEIWICVFSNDFVSDFKNDGDVYYSGEKTVFTPSTVLRNFLVSKLVDSAEKFISYDITTFRSLKAGIYAVYEEYTRTVPNSVLPKSTDNRSVIHKIMIYLSQHFKEPVTLAKCAKDIGYNPEYLSHAMSSIEGINFRFLLNSFRIEYAKNLLLLGQRTIPDIAVESGFSGERSFHRVFLSMLGKTPGEYRKDWKQAAFTTGKGDENFR